MASGPALRGPARRPSERLALAVILLVAAALRIVFGWPQPNAHRAIDERFSLENVESLLRTGRFEPVTAYHPTLSFLPQTAWLALFERCGCVSLGTGESRVVDRDAEWNEASEHRPRSSGLRPVPGLTPLAFRACRLLQAAIGTATVWLIALLGRRLFSPGAGLAAAAIAAGVPWLVWAGGICNEDALLVLGFTVSALATLGACERPTTARFALVGLACGLALATKLNAAAAALPITLWVALHGRRAKELVPRLVLAGAIATLTFAALSPHFLIRFEMVKRDFGVTVGLYEHRGAAEGRSTLGVAVAGLLSPLQGEYLGPLAGSATLAGALLVAFPLASPRRRRFVVGSEQDAARRFVSLAFPALYLLVYTFAAGRAAPHNFLPVAPFAAILAAACAAEIHRVGARLGGFARGALALLAAAIVLSPLALGVRFVYRAVVPTTVSAAEARLDSWAESRVQIGVEAPRDREHVAAENDFAKLWHVQPDADGRFSRETLAALDGWIAARPLDERLERARSEAVAAGARAERIEPGLFARRGPALELVWRPWRIASPRRATALVPAGERSFSFEPSPVPAAGAPLASLRLWPNWKWREGDCWLRSSSRERIALHGPEGTFRLGGQHRSHVSSDRFSADEAEELRMQCTGRAHGGPRFEPEVAIVSWEPAAPGAGVAPER